MKKNFLRLFIMMGMVVFFNQSCTNLDEEVFSEFTEENFPTNDLQFISALGATYTSLYNHGGHNSYFSLNEVASDEIMIPQRGSDWFDGGQWLRVHQHAYNSNEESVNNGWNTLYGGVNNCNRVIALFESLVQEGKVTAEESAAFIGELKVLRGLFYYYLMDMYGNIPIVTSFADAEPNPSTKPRQEVFDFIEQELLDNVPNLAKVADNTTYGRFNFYAGQALLAKLYLNAEVYTGTPQWDKAITACDEIIDSGVYSLEGDYFKNFNTRNEDSKENVYVIPYDENQAQGFVLPAMTMHYSSQETFNLTFQPWNGYCTLQEFYDSYEDGDKRKGVYGDQTVRSNFLAGPQFKSDGVTPIIDSSPDGDPDGEAIVFTPEINEHFPNCLRQAGARVAKFQYKDGSSNNLDNDFPIFRYADIVLMKAEAHMRAGLPGAEMLVNSVRVRAGIEPLSTVTDDDLIAERGREMFYEGWRRQDLIRFGKYNEPWAFKDASDAQKNIFPIPANQLSANPNLQQNPGY